MVCSRTVCWSDMTIYLSNVSSVVKSIAFSLLRFPFRHWLPPHKAQTSFSQTRKCNQKWTQSYRKSNTQSLIRILNAELWTVFISYFVLCYNLFQIDIKFDINYYQDILEWYEMFILLLWSFYILKRICSFSQNSGS